MLFDLRVLDDEFVKYRYPLFLLLCIGFLRFVVRYFQCGLVALTPGGHKYDRRKEIIPAQSR